MFTKNTLQQSKIIYTLPTLPIVMKYCNFTVVITHQITHFAILLQRYQCLYVTKKSYALK
jgi:hypothetical protein